MLLRSIAPLIFTQALLTQAEPIPLAPQDAEAALALMARARPNSPSGSYTPAEVDCPSTKPQIRPAGSLSPEETAWLQLRRNATVQPLIDFLSRVNITGFDARSYISDAASKNLSALPNVAIAVSGGGYRALMNGGGFLAAADNRTSGSLSAGGIGGLLQSSTYLAGLSGGGWLVGSIYTNNFSSVETLQKGFSDSSVWKFGNSIFEGPEEGGIGILNTASYWGDIYKQVKGKSDAGYETSITDYWGRALSYQLINAPDGGPAYTFSSIALDDQFKAGNTPFPILVADERAPGTKIVSLNATNFEFNPFEMGSFDPTTYGFVPTKYLATNFTDGQVADGAKCIEGFDQAGFVMGTSSSLFNQFLLQNISNVANVPDFVVKAIEGVLQDLSADEDDIARYMPNPFYRWNVARNPAANDTQLNLVDGGEDLQNIPLNPLIQPIRDVDVIFAVDSSADTDAYWPNGTALRASYDRVQGTISNKTLFPPVPDQFTFVNKGLNKRPTFFGCDVKNFTLTEGQKAPPLIVYIPNAPYTTLSNVSTFDPSYTPSQRDLIIRNGLNAATQGNGTIDAAWPTCVGCAIMSRSWAKTGATVPSACQDCFKKYCWDGSLDQENKGAYLPNFIIGNDTATSKSAATSFGVRTGTVLAVAGLAGLAALV